MVLSRMAAVMVAAMVAGGVLARESSAEPWTMSERGVVTRQDAHPAGPTPNPLRHVPDELLVKLRPGLPPAAAARALAAVAARSTKRFRAIADLYHMRLAPGSGLHQAMRALRRHPDVIFAEPNFVVQTQIMPNDPSIGSQWSLLASPGINAVPAWDHTTGGSEVVIGVIDTGLDYRHEDLAANVFRNELECVANLADDDGNGVVDDCHGYNAIASTGDPTDDNGHGTHVAGTIGAVGNNATGVAGVAWNVRILPCKFLDSTGTGDVAGAIACLDYVLQLKQRGVNIAATNNSWGGGLFSLALAEAIAAHRDHGILFVASAGNAGANNDSLLTYPCTYEISNVICVAATDTTDRLAWFSNYGTGTVHVAAPGAMILSTFPGNDYQSLDGTSMAAPHVTGVIALLSAHAPGEDWRAIRNRILSGGVARPQHATITHRRLDAHAALTCSAPPLTARLQPRRTQVTSTGDITLAVLNVACSTPAGPVTVLVEPSGQMVTLRDDGLGADEAAGDGIYTSTWRAPSTGSFDLTFPDGSHVLVEADPILKPGFPVKVWHGAGSYQGGQGIHVLVGNIDNDPMLEILVTGLAQGPLYAFKADGTLAPGWPVLDPPGAAYPALGQLTSGSSALDVVAGHFASQARLSATTGIGTSLPGWPRPPTNYMGTPPTTVDVDGDGVDEIFTEEETWHLHGYRADGTVLTGWPTPGFVGGQERHTPAVADLDGDGRLELITASGSMSPGGVSLLAHHHDATMVSGFPVSFNGHVNTYPVVGDVDGDGQPDIVVAGRVGTGEGVYVFAANGVLKRTIPAAGAVFYGTALALADLDGDGTPEIVMQTNTHLNVFKGTGAVLPGWPQVIGASTWLGHASPVVGDVDGDGQPEIVVVIGDSGGGNGRLFVFRRDGSSVTGFPRLMVGLGSGAVPAIADIDGDGRNDIIVASDFWNGQSGYYDKIWAFSLGGPAPHGPILWGQFMAGPKHHGRYGPAPTIVGSVLTLSRAGGGTGTVTSSPVGISCGADCSERFVNGTAVTLTATATGASTFTGWDGACAGQSNPCTVTITAATAVTATFEPGALLTVSRTGDGTGVVASTPAGINCGATCTAAYGGGTVVTLTPTPATGSVFSGWAGACTNSSGTCTVAMTEARSVTAKFSRLFTLGVEKIGTGSGAVTSSPAGIACGADCTEDYASGTTVTLTASADAGSAFVRWNGACTVQSPTCTVTMSAAQSVSATFMVAVPLTVARSGSGAGTVTSTPAGISCGADCGEDYAINSTVELVATPAAGSVFAGWGGACQGAGNPCVVTLTSAQSVTATFKAVFSLAVLTGGSGSGTVTSTPAGITCGSDCREDYETGTSVTLSAAPIGSTFAGWSGDCSGSSPECTVSMTAARTVTASFTRIWTLAVTKSGGGSVASSPSGIACGAQCSATFTQNTAVVLTATPAAGWVFAGWSGGCSGTSTSCTVTMTANVSVSASFTPTLTVTRSGPGTVVSTPSGITCGTACAASFGTGTGVTLTATAASGAVFVEWGGACSGTTPTCTLALSAPASVTASFLPLYTLTTTTVGSGSVASSPSGIACPGDCSESYVSTTTVTLTATAGSGHVFDTWTGCTNSAGSVCTVSMSVDRGVTATFGIATALTVTKTGNGTGTVTSSDGRINCGADCSEVYPQNRMVTLTATPLNGGTFQSWSGACSGSSPTCTVTMSAARTVTARFRR